MGLTAIRHAAAGLAAALFLAAAVFAAPRDPEPAIWTIEKPNGTTVTLFGSVHLLPDGDAWRTKALLAAYESADVIVLETDVADLQAPEMQIYLAAHAVNERGVTLSSLLTADEIKAVSEAATIAAISYDSMEEFRPWYAALRLSVAYALSQGLKPDEGVDNRIEAMGKSDGKAFDYFESAREQLDLFIELTERQQIDFLVLGAKEMQERPDAMIKLVHAWAEGDVELVDELMNQGLEDSPDIAKALLDDRNQRWVRKILNFYLKDRNSYLIVVGAGHLAGDEGVPAKLREAGIEVEGP